MRPKANPSPRGKKKRHYVIERHFCQVGEYLRQKRQESGLTQKNVADALGYSSAQFISNFERGIAIPPTDKIRTLIRLTKLDLHELADLIFGTKRKVFLEELT